MRTGGALSTWWPWALCLLAAAAWALANAPEPGSAAASPLAANHVPTLTLHPAGKIEVRAGERAVLRVDAADPDRLGDGAFEMVWLRAAPIADGPAPSWLPEAGWSVGPSARPRLKIALQPPPDAPRQRFRIEVGATDGRGLTSLGAFQVAVLPPLCATPDFNDGGACRECPANQVPDGSGRACAPCEAGTQRPTGAPSCAACGKGLSSEAGGPCGCGPTGVLDQGQCVRCPPHTEAAAQGNWCVACPPGQERPAGSPECAAAVLAIASKSAPAAARARAREVAVVAGLAGGGAVLWEDAGEVQVRLALKPKPAAGNYGGCRLRLSAGSEAGASDVTFSDRRKLTPGNGWKGQTVLMTLVDDALAEGDETLVVEGYCASSGNGADPGHRDLVSRPLTLTIRDNDAALSLSAVPDAIGESLGRQVVEVVAALRRPAPRPVEVALALGAGAYSVTGTQRISIAAGATRAATQLAFTPRSDSNATDDAVAIGGTAPGHRVTGATLTIREPVLADGVDLSGLGVALSVSPTALREGLRGAHRVSATLTGVPVPKADVAMVLAVGGTATQGASHDYTLKGGRDWRKLTVAANDPFLTAATKVTVSARADGIDEDDETVTFSVTQVAWGRTVVPLRPPAVATLMITEAWERPAPPSGLTAAPSPGDERHGLDVAWEAVAANPAVDGYVVRHRKVSDPPAKWTAAKPQPGLRSALTGLSAGTRYEVRVRADNAAGQGMESGSVFARTADGNCAVGAPQVTAPSGARSATALAVAWRAAACSPAASISNYQVRYREDPDLEGMDNAWLRETANGLTATLAGLTPDTAYVVQVRAVATGGDNGPWSPPGRARTGLDARLPPRVAAPAVAANADHGDERLDVAWRRVTWTDADDVAQPVVDYQYRHRPDGGDWTAPTDARASSGETRSMTRTLAGLASGTWHEVQVRGVNRLQGAAHPGKWSEPGRGRTWGVPDRVKQPAAYGAGGSVAVVWEAPEDGGSPINDYDVQFKADGSKAWKTHPYAGCARAGCATEATVAAAATKVRVRAGNALGEGAWSPVAEVQALKLLRAAFGASSATLAEGGALQVTVRLDGAADRAVTVPLVAAGDADAFRLDGAPGGRLSFSAGESAKTLALAALQDADRDEEAVTLSFGPLPAGVLAGSPATLSLTIEDDDGRNRKPRFAGSSTTRAIAENSAAGAVVGAPVTASDQDGDALTHSLAGADAALFSIETGTGQVRVGPGTALDFEGGPTSYALRVDVSDGKDEAGEADPTVDASVTLTVEVEDVAEPPLAPDAPTLNPRSRSMSARWSAPAHSGPPVTGQVLAHRAPGAAQWTQTALERSATQAEIEGLSPGSAYEVRVRAVNDEGTGPWSAAAVANTLPAVLVEVSQPQPTIGADDAPVAVTLTAQVEAADGTLEGRWERSGRNGTTQRLSEEPFALESGRAVTLSASSSSPGWWLYALSVSHRLDGRESSTAHGAVVKWLPTVVLSADPAAVPEGSARTVKVTAALTGDRVTDAAKSVTVTVAGGTATAAADFAEVEAFSIRIPGGDSSAEGAFELSALADSVAERAETVLVSGSADQAGTALPVVGATLLIENVGLTLTVAPPSNGYVTGVDGGGATLIDCGSGGRSTCAATAPQGTSVTLTPTADAGHGFGGWTGDCSGRSRCKVVLDANRAVGARFAALPGSPGALALSPVGHDGLRASWQAPTGKGTGITAYELRLRMPGTQAWSGLASSGTRTQATITRLAAGTRYEAQVRAAAKEGRGSWSTLVDAVTLPEVSLSVDAARPVIDVADRAVTATLTAKATAATGLLTGRWVRRTAEGLATVNGQPFAMESGRDYKAAFSHDAPGVRAYGLMVSHAANRAVGETGGVVEVRWLPTVMLIAAPSAVAEGGGAQRVSVTARLSGSAVEDVAKSVTVRVGGGTATAGRDFKAVDDFTIALPAKARGAIGRFELAPVADADAEGVETVAVSGSAVQDGLALPVRGATVRIQDPVHRALTVAKPANGRITGLGIDCGGEGADCSQAHPDGTAVTLAAAADSGHLLRGWTGDCSGTGGCVLVMDADKSVGASFAAARTLTVAKPSKGRITGSGIDCGGQGADCSEVYLNGASVTLKAAADASHLLRGWTGDCSGAGDCALAMDADKAVGASFAAKRTLTVARPSNGRVTGKVGAAAVIDCGADCAATLIDGAAVALRAVAADGHRFDSWGGACAAEATAACSLAMDADRSVSASFAAGSTAGRCDEGVVDGCAAGTLNRSVFGDTPSHHRWRCDGSGGGAHSPQCAKAKAGCAAGGRGWSAGGLSCSGSVAAASSGASATARDAGDPTRGSARFLCDDGAWVERPGAACTVDLGCGASEGSCRTPGVRAAGLSSAAPVHGRCAATEAAACWSGTPNRNSPADVAREDGACGTGRNQCAGGASRVLTSTDAAFRWQCLGIDGKKRWSCLGADGGSSWRCEHGGRSRSCSLPTYGYGDRSCSEPAGTALDSPVCLECKEGYRKDGEDCVVKECDEGYHLHNGVCVKDPFCPTPLKLNQCGPEEATWMDVEDSFKHGQCSATGCSFGTPEPFKYAAPKHGKCGAVANDCSVGTAANKSESASTYRWECRGKAGSRNWRCPGKDGHHKWKCLHGAKTQACQLAQEGSDATCSSEAVPATNARGCMACKPGHKLSGGTCVKVLAADAGGDEGRYWALRFGFTPPYIAISATYYAATVSASATGGVPPYRFQWSDHHLSGAQVTYVFGLTQSFPVSRTVTVTDSAAPNATDRATATISLLPPSAAAPGSGAPGPRKGFAFAVPLGGERLFVWGGGGAVTARSEDSGVAGVSVSSPAFRVAGAGAGETHVILTVGGEAMVLPVVVR